MARAWARRTMIRHIHTNRVNKCVGPAKFLFLHSATHQGRAHPVREIGLEPQERFIVDHALEPATASPTLARSLRHAR